MKELFKKDSKNKIRIWKIYTKGAELIQEAGLLEGKLVKNAKFCTGKNIGKSNETTPERQALLELESTWLSKKDEGYFETLDEVNSIEVILPMLAKSYNDEKKKVDWKVYNKTKVIEPLSIDFYEKDHARWIWKRNPRRVKGVTNYVFRANFTNKRTLSREVLYNGKDKVYSKNKDIRV